MDNDAERKEQGKVPFFKDWKFWIAVFGLACTMVSTAIAIYHHNDAQNEAAARVQAEASAEIALRALLKEFGWSSQNLTKEPIKSPLVEESLNANNELPKMSSTNVERRQGITIQYYIKELDAPTYVNEIKVEEALKGLGFKVEIKSPLLPDLATNAVVFGSNVNPDDAKLVAYSLIRAGVEVKAIYKARGAFKPFVIQVVGATFLTDRPSLTVKQVRDTTEFSFPLFPQT